MHQTIVTNNLFSPGERVAVAASGGKDSTVLAHVMTTLNARYKWVCQVVQCVRMRFDCCRLAVCGSSVRGEVGIVGSCRMWRSLPPGAKTRPSSRT